MAKEAKYNKYTFNEKSKIYPATRNLLYYEVYYADDPHNPNIFKIDGLPKFITYGKTGFWIGYVDDENYPLKNNS